jgi:hypothetical protein
VTKSAKRRRLFLVILGICLFTLLGLLLLLRSVYWDGSTVVVVRINVVDAVTASPIQRAAIQRLDYDGNPLELPVSGRFTQATTWYILGGIAVAVVGLFALLTGAKNT